MSFIVFQTRYGWIAILSTSKGLCFLALPEPDYTLAKQKVIAELKYNRKIEPEKIIHKVEYYSDSKGQYFLEKAKEELINYFDGKKVDFAVPIDMEGGKLLIHN